MTTSLAALADQLRPSIVRILVKPKEGELGPATGFFFGHDGLILTCAHVLFREDRIDDLWRTGRMRLTQDVDNVLRKHLEKDIQWLKVETSDHVLHNVKDYYFDPRQDVAVLRLEDRDRTLFPVPFSTTAVRIGEEIFTAGYPYTIQTTGNEWPYAVCRGTITSLVNAAVGGYLRRPLIQAFLPAFGGASGSPVFTPEGKVCGIINGQMLWGASDFVFMRKENETDPSPKLISDSLFVPLPIAFITPTIDAIAIANKLLRQSISLPSKKNKQKLASVGAD